MAEWQLNPQMPASGSGLVDALVAGREHAGPATGTACTPTVEAYQEQLRELLRCGLYDSADLLVRILDL